ncbi:MAG: hypothetical protein ACSHX6_03795 [Akkermansiaceae bacterium]
MNSFSKLKSSLLLLTSFCFISCDSSTPLEFGGSTVSERSPSDETVVNGELFTFEDTLNPADGQFLDTLRVTADNVATVGDINYNYASTGIYTATITADVPTEESLDKAVTQIFSTDNASNTEVRTLLLVTDVTADAPTLTDDEMDRLVELLNVTSAGVSRNPSDTSQIVVTPNRVYSMTFTSSQAERASGIAAGRYSLEARSQVVAFSITTLTDGEGNSFQFYIPTLTQELLDTETFERGTFTLQLKNSLGF